MPYDTLELDCDGSVPHVWLNRPERLNALNRRALDEIGIAFESLQTRFDTQVMVLAGRNATATATPPATSPG